MNKPEAVGRIIQWAIEHSQFDIEYHPRTAIKAQALADFIAEFTFPNEGSFTDEVNRWTIQTDGSSAQRRGGVGVVVITPDKEILKYGVQLKFSATNNEAEYNGILTGLRLGKALGIKNLLVQNDSKLVIGQIRGEYETKEERMQKYLRLMKHLTQEFDMVEFVQIPRSQNMGADEVSKLASSEEGKISMDLAIEVQKHPSIEEVPTFTTQSANSWMTPIISFLQDGHLPQNTKEAKKIKKRAARFTILNDTLYKGGFSMPYLKCVDEEKTRYILKEIHEGICSDHAGPRSLVNKAIRTGYFWPTMQMDAVEIVKKCDKCQRYGNFDNQGFRDFCSNLEIKNQFSSPRHPQANGQTEVTNQTLLNIIKAKLDDAKGAWPEELPNVLWAYRTTARTPTGETPFRLTYGTKAVIPVEVGVTSIRQETLNEECNDDELRLNLDFLDEVRDKASSKMTMYQQKMAEYYNKRVKLKRLDIGDLPCARSPQQLETLPKESLDPHWKDLTESFATQGKVVTT
ncbi:uncharacterized protein LOC115949756 [Quercus lobata]|uniref:uncharacterized protein LOC115949756 n=1 Tax=Quercus lobata TaxID=97700 RepID=UPI001245B671|nr:uncharacterized protein LOC115949756 [Quercus lobata]